MRYKEKNPIVKRKEGKEDDKVLGSAIRLSLAFKLLEAMKPERLKKKIEPILPIAKKSFLNDLIEKENGYVVRVPKEKDYYELIFTKNQIEELKKVDINYEPFKLVELIYLYYEAIKSNKDVVFVGGLVAGIFEISREF